MEFNKMTSTAAEDTANSFHNHEGKYRCFPMVNPTPLTSEEHGLQVVIGDYLELLMSLPVNKHRLSNPCAVSMLGPSGFSHLSRMSSSAFALLSCLEP
ncbi:hypothetical protein M8C21_016244 [Ambrosia artemisiifolia]|uniref:Uncharacterized protein n=1 Tax=Ambrosia artemisiifolia TaxID=4212 RepID=A0AAD5CTC5_AMBAR|nr:hypothetical protein M8C21_016244 [Ambrosia artemisiifolia]